MCSIFYFQGGRCPVTRLHLRLRPPDFARVFSRVLSSHTSREAFLTRTLNLLGKLRDCKEVTTLVYLNRLRWFHSLPILHLFACLTGLIGLVIPSLSYLGIVWTFILILDLPISTVAYGIGWKYGGLATIWVMVVGTLWWYLLGWGAEFVLDTFVRRPRPATLFPPNSVKSPSDRDKSR
jgi:hypothetical protein